MEIGAIIEVINDIATQTNLSAPQRRHRGRPPANTEGDSPSSRTKSGNWPSGPPRQQRTSPTWIKGIQVETNEVVTAMEEGTREVEEGTRLPTRPDQP